MTASAWNWILAIVGTLASIAGVVFSWKAWVQASGAKKAAEEARNAVRRREAAYEGSRLARDAKDFLESVQQNRGEVAIAASNNLAHALSMIRSWRIEHPADSDKLKTCVRDIEGIAIKLTVEGIPTDGPRLEVLLGTCHEIHRYVCDMASKLEHLSEE
jgi:DNA-binding TFAR19-related protein (PDSD5 family)